MLFWTDFFSQNKKTQLHIGFDVFGKLPESCVGDELTSIRWVGYIFWKIEKSSLYKMNLLIGSTNPPPFF